jgi:hypothetical protein
MVAGIVAAAGAVGCTATRPRVAAVAPPPMRHETFTYRPLECRPSGRVLAKAPAEPPQKPDLGAPASLVPAHDPAWEVSIPPPPWRWIVIHHSATDKGCAASFDAWHRNGRHWDELGYHFVIGNGTQSGDGEVEVGSRWPKQKHGAHCRVGDNEEYNYFGIGICLVGNFERSRPTDGQLAALCRLVDYLAATYHIDDSHIIGHGTVDYTRCPGRGFPMDTLLSRLRAARAARQGFASAG